MTMYETIFAWGLFVTPLIGYLLIGAFGPNLGWRILFAIGFIPVINAFIAWKVLPESVRWLIDHHKIKPARSIVDQMESEAVSRGKTLATPIDRVSADVQPTRVAELFSPLYRRRTILSWIQWFCAYFVVYGYGVWLPSLYVRVGHLPAQRSLLITAITSLVGVGITYSLMYFLDHTGRKPVFSFGFALSTFGALVGLVMVVMFHATSWVALFVAALIMGSGGNINAGGVYVYTPELYPTRMRGMGTAVASSMCRIASFISPILVGVLLGSKLGIGIVFVVFGVISAIGLVAMLWLGVETKQKLLEEISP